MFGSILDKTYHRESDIDLIIKFKNISIFEKREIVDFIKEFNSKYFNRKTDIQDYE